jgi:hypothetical protein
MNQASRRISLVVAGFLGFSVPDPSAAQTAAPAAPTSSLEGVAAKSVLRLETRATNLLKDSDWKPWSAGFRREQDRFVCENGRDAAGRRGAVQRLVLNQSRPQPIVASAWSKAEGVGGTSDPDYSIYLDLVHDDGSERWAQTASFRTGTHDWQQARLVIFPERPIKSLSFNMLMRKHAGKASFRAPELHAIEVPPGSALFDGVPVSPCGEAREGFQVRDVAAGSDFVRIDRQALGLELQTTRTVQDGASFFDVTLRDTSGKDRAVTLLYSIPVPPAGVHWLDDPRREVTVEAGREYVRSSSFRAGANGRLSLYPLGAVTTPSGKAGLGLGIDMARPGFFRVGYNAGTGELWIAHDLGLAPERPSARIRFCRFEFDPAWGFRSALHRYYRLFPEAFVCRVPEQGLWMPFARISLLKGWEDFGFRFKEGNEETEWDDAHGVITFRYTEPLTWWMPMSRQKPRTIDSALAEAKRQAEAGRKPARALLTSGYHDGDGQYATRFIDAPWNRGAVWSMNSMPGVPGEVTDFKQKWNPQIKERLYGPGRKGDLDGEYVDSSEGYVTDELDFRRDHFAGAVTPLTFSTDTHQPAIFRGLIAQEYVRGIAADVHGMGKLMMANSTPDRLCWLAPLLDVMGSETDWNPAGNWHPMSDADLLYRRSLCKGKPYCFLMNTAFEDFAPALVEKYMKRSLAYGMFPGFFSHNASEGHYFSRPELYERDRPLFKKYLPLCKLVAQAGWEPITLARSGDERVLLERFGNNGTRYLTVFNDRRERREAAISVEWRTSTTSREMVGGGSVSWIDGKTKVTLEGEDVAVLEFPASN